jgi:hypothetical protein
MNDKDEKNRNNILVRKLEGRNHLRILGINGRIILKWILKNWDVMMWTGFIWLKIGNSGRLLWTQ